MSDFVIEPSVFIKQGFKSPPDQETTRSRSHLARKIGCSSLLQVGDRSTTGKIGVRLGPDQAGRRTRNATRSDTATGEARGDQSAI